MKNTAWFVGTHAGQLDEAETLLNELDTQTSGPSLEMSCIFAFSAAESDTERFHKYQKRSIDLLKTMPLNVGGDEAIFPVLRLASGFVDTGRNDLALPFLEVIDQRWTELRPSQQLRAFTELTRAWRAAGKPQWGREHLKALLATNEPLNPYYIMDALDAVGGDVVPQYLAELNARLFGPRDISDLATLQSRRQFAPPPAWIRGLRSPVNRAAALNGWVQGTWPVAS